MLIVLRHSTNLLHRTNQKLLHSFCCVLHSSIDVMEIRQLSRTQASRPALTDIRPAIHPSMVVQANANRRPQYAERPRFVKFHHESAFILQCILYITHTKSNALLYNQSPKIKLSALSKHARVQRQYTDRFPTQRASIRQRRRCGIVRPAERAPCWIAVVVDYRANAQRWRARWNPRERNL